MEYRASTSMQLPILVTCKNCGLWVDSPHSCNENRDITPYNYHIHYNF